MMLWESALARMDGRRLERSAEPVDRKVSGAVAVECPRCGDRAILVPPKGQRTHVLLPLNLMEDYPALAEVERVRSPYAIAFVETVIDNPGERGAGDWRLRVERP